MSETQIGIKAVYTDAVAAKQAESQILRLLEQSERDLNHALYQLHPFDQSYLSFAIKLDSIETFGSILYLNAYCGQIESPWWLIGSIAQSGSLITTISEYQEDSVHSRYFLGRKRISKKIFDEKNFQEDLKTRNEFSYITGVR